MTAAGGALTFHDGDDRGILVSILDAYPAARSSESSCYESLDQARTTPVFTERFRVTRVCGECFYI